MAILTEPQALQDTLTLIDNYRKNSRFKDTFDILIRTRANARYRNRLLTDYVETIAVRLPGYRGESRGIVGNSAKAEGFLAKFNNSTILNHLYSSFRQSFLGTPAETTESLPETKKTEFVNSIKIGIPSSVKNFAILNVEIPLKRFIALHATPMRIATVVFSTIGIVVGGAANGRMGALAGGAIGAVTPTALQHGGGNLLLKGGGTALKGVGKLAGRLNPAGLAVTAATSSSIRRVILYSVLGVFALIFILPIFMDQILIPNSILPPFVYTGEAAPLPPGGGGGPGGSPGGGPGGSPGGGNQQPPGGGGGGSLGYYIPFRDTSVSVADPTAVKTRVQNNWPNAQLQNWDTIVRRSIENGWNPAFVLTLWIEETGAQGKTPYDDPLGCAPDPNNPNTNIDIALGCLFRSFPLSSYPNEKFAEFMCQYSGDGHAPCDFKTNPNFPGNVGYWYSQLVPGGSGAITTPTPPPSGSDLRIAIKSQFNITFDNSSLFTDGVLSWAQEALSRANSAPNFFPLLRSKGLVTVTTSSGVGSTSGTNVFISASAIASGRDFFEQNLIHELGHVIHGTRANTTYSTQAAVAADGGYVSGYAQGATAANVACNSANSGETIVQLDEDFAETVSYYINTNIPEQNYSKTNSCPPRSTSINPLASGKYPGHIQYIKSILGGNNF